MAGGIIELKNLTKQYGTKVVVDDLNLNIQKGEIFGLLGPNGAGKSTTIRMLMGMTPPTSGEVRVSGFSSLSHPLEVKRRVGYLPEDVGFYNNMSGFENLMFTAKLNRLNDRQAREKVSGLLKTVDLEEHAHKKAGAYSRGMRQRLGLADTLIKNPEVIILDEPTLGIDPNGIKAFLDLIVRLSRQQGITVLFSSHHLHQVQQVCDRVGIFTDGKLIADGDLPALSQKLFSKNPFVLEISASPQQGDNGAMADQLGSEIEALASVKKVERNGSKYLVECTEDVSPAIAGIIVNKKFDLYSLTRKEFGLDDIYYRYFEGGTK